jgi:hypothetical protein
LRHGLKREISLIIKALFSPERGQKRRRQKPFFLRWWFYWPVGLIALAALLAWAGWAYFSVKANAGLRSLT